MNEYSKGTGYKVNIKKATALLYTRNEQLNFKFENKYHL